MRPCMSSRPCRTPGTVSRHRSCAWTLTTTRARCPPPRARRSWTPVKHATEVFGMVTAEVTSLKARPDLDPLQKARVVAQLCAVAMQALALCHADYKHTNDWHMRQRSSNRGYDCARRRTTT